MSKDCSKLQMCKRCGEEGHMVRECTQEEKTRQMIDEEGKVGINSSNPSNKIKTIPYADQGDLRAQGIQLLQV